MTAHVVDWRRELAKKKHMFKVRWMEAAAVARSLKILPRLKRLMGSILGGRYAIATCGVKTYGAF